LTGVVESVEGPDGDYYVLDPTPWEATACQAAGRNLT
jgi:hypothetical protein